MKLEKEALKVNLKKSEPLLFVFFCLLALLPIWSVFAFVTQDGQGHIYNGQLLMSQLSGQNGFVSKYAEINSSLSPNWISHPIIAILTSFFSPFAIEKIITSLGVLLFVFSWRKFILAFFPHHFLLSLAGFVFVWNSTITNGFFNYNFGVALLFLNLALLKSFRDQQSTAATIKLAIAMLLLYLSHLIPFCVFGLAAVSYIISDLFFLREDHSPSPFRKIKIWIKLFTAACLPLTLLFMHIIFMFGGKPSEATYLHHLTDKLLHLAGYNVMSDREWGFSRWYYYLIMAAVIISFIVNWNRKTPRWSAPSSHSVFIFLLFALTLACTYYLPDGTGFGGGMLTIRLVYLTTTSFLLLLMISIKNNLVLGLLMLSLLILQVDKHMFIHARQQEVQDYCHVIDQARSVIDQPGLMYVADFKRRWPLVHVTDALGFHHDVLMAHTWLHKPFNPIIWKPELHLEQENMPWLDNEGICNSKELVTALGSKIMWYVIAGNPTAAKSDSLRWSICHEMLEQNYVLRFESKGVLSVYELREP